MTNYTFRPAKRENTPLIIGIAGPTKSGKTYSALRLARGLANGKPVAMINAEGPRGHQYAETFQYVACDISAPYRTTLYTEVLGAAMQLKPGAIIIDSVSHSHDGPGGTLEWHEEILNKMAGDDMKKRDRCNFTAWVKPKAGENQFIYKMLSTECPLILCMRAKEKVRIEKGKEPVDLGWQPIVGERVAFETIFTLILPPHSKGVPDLAISEMREPFDTLVPGGKQIDEQLGKRLAEWARGGQKSTQPKKQAEAQPDEPPPEEPEQSELPETTVVPEESAFEDDELRTQIHEALLSMPDTKRGTLVQLATKGTYETEDDLLASATVPQLKDALARLASMIPKKKAG